MTGIYNYMLYGSEDDKSEGSSLGGSLGSEIGAGVVSSEGV